MEHTPRIPDFGLRGDEAHIYSTLLQYGRLRASKLAQLSGVQRTLVYRYLPNLIEYGLVREITTGSVQEYLPEHPDHLRSYIQQNQSTWVEYDKYLTEHWGDLVSQYNRTSGRPNIRFNEGADGIQDLYTDILDENKDILLIRSVFDNEYPELNDIVQEQIRQQITYDIHVRAITPSWGAGVAKATDQANLVERRIFPRSEFELPAQIIIYGDKVALSSFKNSLTTSIIENQDIADTMRILFEHLWSSAAVPADIPASPTIAPTES